MSNLKGVKNKFTFKSKKITMLSEIAMVDITLLDGIMFDDA